MAWAYVLSKQSSVRSPSSGSDADTEVIGLAVSLLLMLGTETAGEPVLPSPAAVCVCST